MKDKSDLPAFPTQSFEYDGQNNVLQYQEPGMSLRDYFAAQAMQAVIRRFDGLPFGGGSNPPEYKELAQDAYYIADAMLKARSEQ